MTQTVRINANDDSTIDTVTVVVGDPSKILIDVTRYDVQYAGGIIDPMRINHWDKRPIPSPKPSDKVLYQDVEPDEGENDD